MSEVLPPRIEYLLSAEDWLQFPDDGRFYEVVEGELYVSPPPTTEHQRIAGHLYTMLRRHLEATSQGEVLFAPVGVRLSEHDVVEPDLVVMRAEHAERVRDRWIEGPPDLVVEILSPGTAGRDLVLKRELYERAGVPEYWIVDPKSRSVEVLHLERGRYGRDRYANPSDLIRSRTLSGFQVSLEAIFHGGTKLSQQ